jgi:ATP-dependent protease ClpP protease subunit
MSNYDIYWGLETKQNNTYILSNNKKRKLNDISDNDTNKCNHDNSIFKIGNEIYFTCGIDNYSIQLIIKYISEIIHEHLKEHKKNKNDKTYNNIPELDIVYIVDSPGGSVSAVLKFVDFIKIIKDKYKFIRTTSIISGMVASAGTIMALTADEKIMTKNANAMIHELSAGNRCKFTEFKSYMTHLQTLNDRLVNIYCLKTKKTKEEIELLLNKETWFSADEYYKNGFVDKIK